MAIPFSTLQMYDQYLTTYRSRDNNTTYRVKNSRRSSRHATHDAEELKDIYTTIQWKNRFAPLYMTDPSPKSIAFAVHLKESANGLKQTIDSLSGEDDELFSMKTAYSDNEDLVSVEYIAEDADDTEVPQSFSLEVESFATPQINTSKFLKANQTVALEPNSYSFDILTNKLHYELQFNVNEGETNNDLQQKLARLINNSDIGVSAKVVETRGLSALEITSEAYGLPYQGERHFTINDDNTSYNSGIVDYLGLNKSIREASNAIYTINGSEESSYSNSFSVHGAYHVTLHPENSTPNSVPSKNITAQTASVHSSNAGNATIGLYPDGKSLSNNIETFVEGYNHFLNGVLKNVSDETEDVNTNPLTRLLANDLHKFLERHSTNLEQYGIHVNEDATLEYEKNEDIADAEAIKGFGHHILKKLNSIALDPMEYVDRRICAYPNPNATYPNPYMTSIYTGMLFSIYM